MNMQCPALPNRFDTKVLFDVYNRLRAYQTRSIFVFYREGDIRGLLKNLGAKIPYHDNDVDVYWLVGRIPESIEQWGRSITLETCALEVEGTLNGRRDGLRRDELSYFVAGNPSRFKILDSVRLKQSELCWIDYHEELQRCVRPGDSYAFNTRNQQDVCLALGYNQSALLLSDPDSFRRHRNVSPTPEQVELLDEVINRLDNHDMPDVEF